MPDMIWITGTSRSMYRYPAGYDTAISIELLVLYPGTLHTSERIDIVSISILYSIELCLKKSHDMKMRHDFLSKLRCSAHSPRRHGAHAAAGMAVPVAVARNLEPCARGVTPSVIARRHDQDKNDTRGRHQACAAARIAAA